MKPTTIVHTLEVLAFTGLGAGAGYLETFLAVSPPTGAVQWKTALAGAAAAGVIAVANRVRGVQFGVVQGVNVATPPAAPSAEAPTSEPSK